jgi:hypothetical protein
MDKLIFGSTACKHWFSDFREPKDLDYISKEKVMTKEVQSYWVDSFQLLLDNNNDSVYLDPNFLITVKMSHGGFDIHWEKTMRDIVFLKERGCVADRDIYKKLVKDWKAVHGKRWASLKGKDSKSFFEDAVKRKYVHDDIHAAIAADKPVYFKILKDGSDVECSEEKFNLLSHEERVILAREEIWVTALERFLIPNDFKYSNGLAYLKSLKKFATTMSSGFMKFWILDNFKDLMIPDGPEYVNKFKQALKDNKISLCK